MLTQEPKVKNEKNPQARNRQAQTRTDKLKSKQGMTSYRHSNSSSVTDVSNLIR
jgi:hypothetical protein